MKAKLIQAKADLARAEELVKKNALARSDYDAAMANAGVAEANIAVDEAAIEQAKAVLDQAKTNLGYTTIVSPVKGVIVDRKVNVGQTVVSAMNTSSLFLLAKDLSRLQVWASVNEADIGRIHVGQSVRFTVSAYRNESFYGQVVQLRLNATTTSNVVIFTVVVETDNSSMKLLPYLTAYLEFELEHHKDVLIVPNAALRWKPRPSQISPELREVAKLILYDKSGEKDNKAGSKDDTDSRKSPADSKPEPGAKSPGEAKQAASPNPDAKAKTLAALKTAGNATPDKQAKDESGDPKSAAPARDREHFAYIWIKEGNFVRPLRVRVVATDGVMTEVAGNDVQEGMEAVIGEEVTAPEGGTTNPLFGKRK
jgi:multidrug efflux pump subunit AcrA (membrane-fusion protein)